LAVKRRVIWLDDERWETLGKRAEVFHVTRSAYIAKLIGDEDLIQWPGSEDAIPPFTSQPHTPERVAEIEARHPERSFAEFRPVPKPGRK